MRHVMPPDTFPDDCVVVLVPIRLFSIVSGEIARLEQSFLWDNASFQDGYNLTVEMEAHMVSNCVSALVESNNRLYRVIDAGFFGRVYDAGATPPETITPAIPAVPDLYFADPGLLGKTEYLSQLIQSKLAGIDTPNFSGTPNVLTLLQGIIDALASDDTDIAQIVTDLELVIALLG